MHAAKECGRGNVQRYAAGMTPWRGTQRSTGERPARRPRGTAVRTVLSAQGGHTPGRGAQRRGAHPLGASGARLVSPGDFIPLAEECGLIGSIGEWVIREACRQARAWQAAGVPQLRVSVNLAASQFRDWRSADIIRGALDDAGPGRALSRSRVTETAVMTDPEQSITILEQLSAMGVLVSVDDFGTGYSSMSYLRRLPIDKLKIDRVFIDEIASRAADASIVRAIISLAHSLGLKWLPRASRRASSSNFSRRRVAMNIRALTSAARCPPPNSNA